MIRASLLAALSAVLCAAGEAAAQGRAKADVSCRPAAVALEYDCTIKLTDARTEAALTGATLTVGADMPSMPMVHNIRPVKAAPGAEPGLYHVRLELQMHGDWVLRLDVSGTLRDRVVVPLRFDDITVRRPSPSRAAPQRGH